MTKNKKMIILCAIIIAVVLIICTVILVLALNTDMFKSKNELLSNYIVKNVEYISEAATKLGDIDNNSMLDGKKYTSTTNIKLNYTSNVSTNDENKDNSINNYTCVMEGKTDNTKNYDYQDIKIMDNQSEEKAHLEYLKDDNNYGIKLSDLFNQYISVDNNNLSQVYEKVTNGDSTYIPDNIPELKELGESIQFTEEEKSVLENKYGDILKNQFEIGNITKENNKIINVNEKDIKTTSYTLTLTREEINDIFLKLLEEVKQEDIILSKLDKLDEVLNFYNTIVNSNETSNLKGDFVSKVEKTIKNINETNIGQEETEVIVYVKGKNVLRTQINYPEYELDIDCSENEYIRLTTQKIATSESNTYTVTYNDNETKLDIKNNKNGDVEELEISETMQASENDMQNDIVIIHSKGTNRTSVTINREINFVDELSDLPEVKEEDKIKLNDLDKETTSKLVDRIKGAANEKIKATFVNNEKEDFNTILKAVGILKESQTIESTGITETEKNRYNSQFEILQGEDLNGENIITSLKAIQKHISGIEVASNTKLKIKLEKNKANEEVFNQLTDFIEANKQMIYNVKIEYDENGIAKYMVLDLVIEE